MLTNTLNDMTIVWYILISVDTFLTNLLIKITRKHFKKGPIIKKLPFGL